MISGKHLVMSMIGGMLLWFLYMVMWGITGSDPLHITGWLR